MNKKFYLAGALALALSMAKPQFAFAVNPETDGYAKVMLTIDNEDIQATVHDEAGADYAIWSKGGVYFAFVKNFTKQEVTIKDEVNLGTLYGNKNVKVIGFDTTEWNEVSKNVTSIVFQSKGIEGIEDDLFKGFTDLTTVRISSAIKTIGEEAFAGCTALKTFGFTNAVEGECRIQNCITSIGSKAFEGAAFEKIYVQSSTGAVTFGDVNPWKDCTSLAVIDSKSTAVTAANNMLIYDKKLITYALGAAAVETLEIDGETITEVIPYALAGNANAITTLTVAEGVNLNADAFENVYATNVVFEGKIEDMDVIKNALSTKMNQDGTEYEPVPSANVKSLTIEDLQLDSQNETLNAEQLYALTALENLTIKSKADSKFVLVPETEVPATLKTLTLDNVEVEGALYDGTTLETLTLKNAKLNACPFVDVDAEGNPNLELALTLDMTNVGSCLQGCKSIVSADLINKKKADDYLFNGCENLATVTWDENLFTVGANAFLGTQIAAISLFNENTEIKASAFEGTKLTSVDFKNVTKLGVAAFKDCTQLATVYNCTVAEIPASLFKGCSALESISLTGLTSVGTDALKGCTALTTVTLGGKAAIPDEDGNVSTAAVPVELTAPVLEGCDALASLTLKDVTVSGTNPIHTTSDAEVESQLVTLKFDNVTYTKEHVANIPVKNITIANGDVAEYSFEGKQDIESITLTNVNRVGQMAFKNASLKADESGVVPTVSLTSVKELAAQAFYGTNITSADLSNITRIEGNVFAKCSNLKEVELTATTTIIGVSAFKESGVTKATLTGVTLDNSGSTPKIFEGTQLSDLTLDNVNFKTDEFAGLPITRLSATDVELPADAFKANTTIEAVKLLGTTTLAESAFEGCTSLSAVNSDSNLNIAEISKNAFNGCAALTAITLGADVETIAEGAFAGTNLTTITLPAKVSSLGNDAFAVAGHLETVNVLNTNQVITLVDNGKPFNEVTVPIVGDKNLPSGETVTIVGNEDVDNTATPETRELNPTTLNVPANLLEDYKTNVFVDGSYTNATQWQAFFSAISENVQNLSWNHMEGDVKKNGTDYTNETQTNVSKLTFERELPGAGWYDWYEPFDVTVGDLKAKGIEVAQIYNVMATINEKGSIGDRETNLLCYIVTDEDRIIHANTPYMIRKAANKEDNDLKLELTADGEILTPIYQRNGDIQGDFLGYKKKATTGSKNSIILYDNSERVMSASSLRSQYYFKGNYHYQKIMTSPEVKITTFAFGKNGGLVLCAEDPGNGLYGQRWYMEIRDNNEYALDEPYNNSESSNAKAPSTVNIIATYEQQDAATGISVIENTIAAKAEGIYTVDGKKVDSLENMPSGVYVVNGKAVYKK